MSAGAIATFKAINVALELYTAGNAIMSKLTELQQRREAEGREISDADVVSLMNEGDVKAAIERATLLSAKAAQATS